MPAAGSGRRFGGDTPKQYLPLAGARVIEHAMAPFLADAACAGIIVAVDPADQTFDTLAVARDTRVRRVPGGARRCDSVRQALAAVPGGDDEWVLVHDAARPCIAAADVRRLLAEVVTDAAGGLLAVPMADTLKRSVPAAAGDGPVRVADTAAREGLWRALTPQMFRAGVLRAALDAARAAGREPTDEAQAVEWQGLSPRLVAGDPGNIKITSPPDLALADAWLARERGP